MTHPTRTPLWDYWISRCHELREDGITEFIDLIMQQVWNKLTHWVTIWLFWFILCWSPGSMQNETRLRCWSCVYLHLTYNFSGLIKWQKLPGLQWERHLKRYLPVRQLCRLLTDQDSGKSIVSSMGQIGCARFQRVLHVSFAVPKVLY